MSQDDNHISNVTTTPASPSHEAHSEAEMVRRSISFHCPLSYLTKLAGNDRDWRVSGLQQCIPFLQTIPVGPGLSRHLQALPDALGGVAGRIQ